ncbi:hypothetical protein [Candidatus Nitrotoga sp. 1052]
MTISASGIQHRWVMCGDRKSPNYTTLLCRRSIDKAPKTWTV